MKKLLSIVLTGALALSGGVYCIRNTNDFSAFSFTMGTYEQFGYYIRYYKYEDHVEISGCDKSATEVVIPDEIDGLPVTEIEGSAFNACAKMTSVTIPNSVTEIGHGAFSMCLSLISVTIPDSVTKLDDSAFYCCESLPSITIPNSVKSIGRYAFDECVKLESVTIENPYCDIYDNANTISDTAVIYGYENSTAQGYAEKYNREFVVIDGQTTEEVKGDVNGDNSVTIADAVAILQYLANSDEYALSEQGLKNADVLGDDGVNTEDALQIQKLDAGVIDKL